MLGVLGKSIQPDYPDTDHIKDERIATDGITQIGDRKMKKMIFAIAMSVGFAAGASAQTTWQMNSNGSGFGWDNKGNSYHSQTDRMGNTHSYDSRGNSSYSHQSQSGNINGWNSRGNSFQGHSDRQGNSYTYDNKGNSRNCQKVGAFTQCN
ncbi:hypothetical protein N9S57_01720 [Luminiphilus sp.]|nr:hypothetical protein [Luminiphilus sp.]MDA9625470.1 hypothetical protein [Luminiphilus sp.]